MNITALNITKFRHLKNLEISLGNRLTAIAGQNGIGKSSILGLLGHVCREKSRYRSLDNKSFETEFSEVFKFSYPDYDKPREHEYVVNFDDESNVRVISLARREKVKKDISLRLRTYKTDSSGEKEEAKKDFPVLYLGLKRLIPLAQEIDVFQNDGDLSDEDIKLFNDAHNSILLLDENVTPRKVDSTNKAFYAASTDKYDSLGNSAGQDNIGQIITAILSFKVLKQKLGNSYNGGLLLIDEIDATLYSAAQEKLIEFLFQQSAKLDLQIVFTTHSIEILETLLTTKYKYHAKVCYLKKVKGNVSLIQDNDIERILFDLKARVYKKAINIEKVDIYLEDKEAQIFFKNIVNSDLKKKVQIRDITFGGDELLKLANRRIPAFTNSIILLDGDKKPKINKPYPKNVISLPGDERPENIIFSFLKKLSVGSDFWNDEVGGYSRQVCFRDRQNIGNRDEMKDWFNKQLPFWGKRIGNNLFNLWKKENSTLVEKFNKDLEKLISKLSK